MDKPLLKTYPNNRYTETVVVKTGSDHFATINMYDESACKTHIATIKRFNQALSILNSEGRDARLITSSTLSGKQRGTLKAFEEIAKFPSLTYIGKVVWNKDVDQYVPHDYHGRLINRKSGGDFGYFTRVVESYHDRHGNLQYDRRTAKVGMPTIVENNFIGKFEYGHMKLSFQSSPDYPSLYEIYERDLGRIDIMQAPLGRVDFMPQGLEDLIQLENFNDVPFATLVSPAKP